MYTRSMGDMVVGKLDQPSAVCARTSTTDACCTVGWRTTGCIPDTALSCDASLYMLFAMQNRRCLVMWASLTRQCDGDGRLCCLLASAASVDRI